MTRSAIVVVIGAAEPLVGGLRAEHDPMARRGVPAHVTVLHPFRPVVDAAAAATIAALAVEFRPFEVTFERVGRFPGEVVYLAPEPAEAFVAMTNRFVEVFPDCPPYGGAFADPVPHLTVGSRLDGATADLVAESAAASSADLHGRSAHAAGRGRRRPVDGRPVVVARRSSNRMISRPRRPPPVQRDRAAAGRHPAGRSSGVTTVHRRSA